MLPVVFVHGELPHASFTEWDEWSSLNSDERYVFNNSLTFHDF